MSDADLIQPTLLMVGQGEPMDAALRVALDRHGVRVEECVGDVKTAVRMAAPDVVFLVGDAAADGGRALLDILAIDPVTNVVPVIVLSQAEKLDSRVTAFRAGAVAVVPRTASADQIATRVAEITRDLAEPGGSNEEQLGEATFDELVSMVAQELRSGILSVGRANTSTEPMRIVLGAGRPVADAVEEFVRKLRPLVSRAEPLIYQLHASAGGPVGLLDPEPGGRADLGLLRGLRIILVDADASRADALAQQLRGSGAVVAVADPSARGLARARGLDPEVVIVDAAGMEGPGFEVVQAIRRDVRLRWAAMLVAPWADLWPETAATPDLGELVERIRPLVANDRELRERATHEAAFDTRLEATGPSRLLRILAALPGPFHITLANRKATVEIDVAEGLVVGARATRAAGDALDGTRALAAMLAMATSRVHVERRANPSLANVMAPVDEALAQASLEAAPIPLSTPPPPMDGPARAGRKPFPTASEVGRGLFEDDAESSGPRRAPEVARTRASVPKGDTSPRDLKWAESEAGEARGSLPQGLFSNATPVFVPRSTATIEGAQRPRAALSAFGDTKETALTDGEAPAPPRRPSAPPDPGTLKAAIAARASGTAAPRPPPTRKQTLVMGARPAPVPSERDASVRVPPSRPPAPGPSTTLVMGAVEPSPSERPIAAARFPAPGVVDQHGTTAVPTKASRPGGRSATTATTADDGAARAITTADFGTQSIEAEPPAAFDPFRESPVPAARVGAPPLPASAFVHPTAPRERVATPPYVSLPDPSASEPFLPDIELPPVPPRAADATAAAPPPPPLLAPEPPAGRAPSPPPIDPAPLGVISAPTRPSGVHGARGAPPAVPALAAAPASDPGGASDPRGGVPTAAVVATTGSAPAASGSAGRSVAWMLVALGALAVASLAGWLAWMRFGADLGLGGGAGLGAGPGLGAVPLDAGPLDAGPLDTGPLDTGPTDSGPTDTGPTEEAAAVVLGDSIDAGEPEGALVAEASVDAGVDAAEEDVGIDAPVETPEPPPSDPGGETAEQLVERAEGLPDAQAENLYRRAIALDPRNHYAMLGVAEVLMRRGAAQEAIPFIEGAIRRRGRRAEYRVLLGDARRDAGDAEGARAAWRQALEIDPDDHDAHARLGE